MSVKPGPGDAVASDTGGARPMTIARRMVRERERCIGMTDEERAWRKQWLIDQKLAPNEPVFVPELFRITHNPIKRFYRAPLDAMYNKLTPYFGMYAYPVRYITGKFIMIYLGILGGVYYFKYNQNDWTRKKGWVVLQSRQRVLPGDTNSVNPERTKPSDYYDRNFKNSPL